MSTKDARQRNMQSMEKIDTTELSGGVMPADLFQQFYQEVQDESDLLGMVRTVEMPRKEMDIPSIGISNRVMQQVGEDSSITGWESANTGDIHLETTKTAIPFELTAESVEDTVDDVADILLRKFQTQFATDSQDLAINGDTSGSGFVSIMDGWIEIAENGDSNSNRLNGTMPTNDALSDPINTGLINDTIQSLGEKYRDPGNQVLMMSRSQLQQYHYDLTQREDGLGVPVLQGDNDVTPFNFTVVGVANWPDAYMMLTNPMNLIYGLYRDVEIDVVDSSDETLERDLFARYVMRARWDVNIEDPQAGVLTTDIQSP